MPIMTVILSQQFWQMKANTDQHNTIQNTVILSQQFWQMKANTDQHNTIKNTLAMVFKRN